LPGTASQNSATSAIYALNNIDVEAPAEVVWKLLVDAENWSSYFPAEDQVKILTGEPELALETKCCATPAATLSPTLATTRGRFRIGWVIARSSTR
jgi:carbon monoxide dehydrogenase subunit G